MAGNDEQKDSKIVLIATYTIIAGILLSLIPIFTYFQHYDMIFKLLIYVCASGGIGGIVFSVLGFTKHYVKGDFDLKYYWWYLYRPIIAAIVGVFAFFFIAGGVFTLTSENKMLFDASSITIANKMVYMALSFLAGFSTNYFVAKLKDLSSTIFSRPAEESDGQPKKIEQK